MMGRCSNSLQNEHITTMLLQSNRDGRMSVITVLRVSGTHTFSFVNPERFLTTQLEVGKRYDHHGNS